MYITKSINVEGKELRREREKRKEERRKGEGRGNEKGDNRKQEATWYKA